MVLAIVSAVAAGCGDDEAAPSFSTIAVTSTAYVTIPARTTTSSVARDPDDDSTGVAIEPAVANDPTRERTYEIKAGDFLMKIARDFDLPVDNIIEYNAWPDGVRHALVPGDEILIPPSDYDPDATDDSAEARAADESIDDDSVGECPDGEPQETYTIRAGDFPARVARDNDTTVEELAAANEGVVGYPGFVVGVQINLPC